jgi:hypothetical protein
LGNKHTIIYVIYIHLFVLAGNKNLSETTKLGEALYEGKICPFSSKVVSIMKKESISDTDRMRMSYLKNEPPYEFIGEVIFKINIV